MLRLHFKCLITHQDSYNEAAAAAFSPPSQTVSAALESSDATEELQETQSYRNKCNKLTNHISACFSDQLQRSGSLREPSTEPQNHRPAEPQNHRTTDPHDRYYLQEFNIVAVGKSSKAY